MIYQQVLGILQTGYREAQNFPLFITSHTHFFTIKCYTEAMPKITYSLDCCYK